MKYKNFINHLKERGIEGFLFDVDGTLTQTTRYYFERMENVSILLAKKLRIKEEDQFTKQILHLVNQIYEKRKRKPEPITERYIDAIELYLEKEVDNELKDYITTLLKDFYLHTPEPYEDALDLLKELIEARIPISLHSHAQYEWTRIKAEALSNLINYKLPFLATDIFQSKDKESWKKALEIRNFNPLNTFIMGDNFESDILSASEAGAKNFVWIDRRNERGKERVLDKDINIIIVEEIKELRDLTY